MPMKTVEKSFPPNCSRLTIFFLYVDSPNIQNVSTDGLCDDEILKKNVDSTTSEYRHGPMRSFY